MDSHIDPGSANGHRRQDNSNLNRAPQGQWLHPSFNHIDQNPSHDNRQKGVAGIERFVSTQCPQQLELVTAVHRRVHHQRRGG